MNPPLSSSLPPTTVSFPPISSIIAPTPKDDNEVLHNSVPVPHNSENQISTNVYPLDTSSNAILQEYDDPPSTMGIYETSSSMAPSLVDALHAIMLIL
ncbi:hypothetical protein Csa_012961 [Cucumis sativus]|uniref:Uncharacterized protein n=1 Tax=Cucumis sativus TaxID=3659 RepID=A0A0A0KYW3_CUCSA|nr:hypothetical protein Csa_012961 [Cucumis sativus]